MGRKLYAKVEPRFLPFFGRNWLALLNQAIQVEGCHGLQTLQRLWDVRAEVGDLKRWNLRDDVCSLRIARECDLILQERRSRHGLNPFELECANFLNNFNMLQGTLRTISSDRLGSFSLTGWSRGP